MSLDAQRIQSIFLMAAEIADPEKREHYLAAACEGNAELRSRVEKLLLAHSQPDSLLDQSIGEEHGPNSSATRTFSGEGSASADKEDEIPLGFLTPPMRSDSLGRIGHYEVLQILGHGGFGIVFRAFDDTLQRVVAVKVLSPQMASTSPARKRFLREARSSAQVRHENVVQVYEVGETPLPYIAMEFIPGETLQQRLDRKGPLEVPTVIRIGRQLAEGLAAAHANDLIHRDIKPGNILLEGGNQKAKITDFGLARAADDASISQSGIIAGTPMYMAPEQAKGETLDQRADLFSLGSVLYQMVTGRPPFRANGTIAVLKRVAEDEPRDIREIIPETPQWLCDIIAKLHQKNPEERFQTAREVADVFADCENQLKVSAKLTDFSRIPSSKRGKSPLVRGPWIAAAAIMLPLIALAVSEALGISHLLEDRRQGESNPLRAIPAIPPIQREANQQMVGTAADRAVAEWLLSMNGSVRIDGRDTGEIKKLEDLPQSSFLLTAAVLIHAPIQDSDLARFKPLQGLQSLDLGNTKISDDGLVHLKEIKSLKWLSLHFTEVTNAGLIHLRDLPALEHLWLGGTKVNDDGLILLYDFKALARLGLSSLPITDAGLSQLVNLKLLTEVWLAAIPITDAGLANLRTCKQLTQLNLHETKVTGKGVAEFQSALPNCTINWDKKSPEPVPELDASAGPDRRAAYYVISQGGAVAVNDSPNQYTSVSQLPNGNLALNFAGLAYKGNVSNADLAVFKECLQLNKIDLCSCEKVTDEGLKNLENKNFIYLNLCSTKVTDEGLQLFRASRNLDFLVLDGTRISDSGLKAFKDCDRITWLQLDTMPNVTDAGLAHFKANTKLQRVWLEETPITDAGLVHLQEMKDLIELKLANSRVTALGVEKLAKALPKCKITWNGGTIEPK